MPQIDARSIGLDGNSTAFSMEDEYNERSLIFLIIDSLLNIIYLYSIEIARS